MKTALDIFSQAVRKAREDRQLSQRDLAHKLNMNTWTIMELEIGRSNPKAETLFLIASELQISMDALLYAGSIQPNAVSADALEFFASKGKEESQDYIRICRQVEALSKRNKEC